MVKMTNRQFDDLVASFEYSAFRRYGQAGRRTELIPLVDGEMISALWEEGMYDWQIARKLKLNLYVVQEFLTMSGIDYTQRRTENYKRIYFLSSTSVLFDGAAFLLMYFDSIRLTVNIIQEAVTKFPCSLSAFDVQLISEGRLMPSKQQLLDLIRITGISKDAWCDNSTDVNNILNKNIVLPAHVFDFAITQDQFLSTYKKFPIHSALVYTRLLKGITPGYLQDRKVIHSVHDLYDMEAGQVHITYDKAQMFSDILGIELSDIYHIDVLPGGYYNLFNNEARAVLANCTKRKVHSAELNHLVYSTVMDNLAGVERSVLHAKRK